MKRTTCKEFLVPVRLTRNQAGGAFSPGLRTPAPEGLQADALPRIRNLARLPFNSTRKVRAPQRPTTDLQAINWLTAKYLRHLESISSGSEQNNTGNLPCQTSSTSRPGRRPLQTGQHRAAPRSRPAKTPKSSPGSRNSIPPLSLGSAGMGC